MTPHLHHVPKDPGENLRWRIKLRRASLHDRGLQQAVSDACDQDVLFWFNACCWTFDPRALVKIRPFVTWPHQDPEILKMDQAITDSERSETPIDVVVDKSRTQGATWIYLLIFVRRWRRDPMFSAGLVTRNEKLVDSRVDPDTLLWKVAWSLEMFPWWMLPEGFSLEKHRSLSDHSILNPANGANIVGYSATGDVASGGRKTVFAFDEVAKFKPTEAAAAMDSTQHVTRCRFIVSTHKGDSGVYYDAVFGPNNAVHCVLDWKNNPTQNKTAYVVRDGKPVAVDPLDQPAVDLYFKTNATKLRHLERIGHKMEGKFRSPAYDAECLRPGATPRSIAQEMDRDPKGTVGKVFDVDVLAKMKAECVQPPIWQGKLVFDAETLDIKGLIRQDNGPLKLWFKPGIDHAAPHGDFGIGCDIAAGGAGEYSSNSAAFGIDLATGEQVLAYTVMGMMGTKFARVCVALSRWLCKAYLGWEASGAASPFAREVMEVLCYGNVYYREVEEVGNRAKSRKAGWWNGSDEDKGELFEAACIGMEAGQFIPRDEDYVRECGEYEWDGGKIVHKPSVQHGVYGAAHGDRCVAGGVAWLLRNDRPMSSESDEEREAPAPYGSFLWRQQREEEELRTWDDSRPQFTLHDLMRSA